MSTRIIQARLASYACKTALEEEQALREITQEIVLAALGRTDFFQRAGFHGGTCLRIFHGLPRFSEDLDFALVVSDGTFRLTPYLEPLSEELAAYGYQLEIDDRSKASVAVQKVFLKDDSLGNVLQLSYRPATGPLRKIRVKLEVDTNPPAGARYEMPILDFPFISAVRVFDLTSLLAGKIHALLCREYVKGRDWYDFVWYASRRISINYVLLASALKQAGPWAGQDLVIGSSWCVGELETIINRLDSSKLREDVKRFVKPQEVPSLNLWSKEFFIAQCRKLFG